MSQTQVVTKAAFSRHLGVSRARVSQYISMGLPCRPDGRLDLRAALAWVRANVMSPSSIGTEDMSWEELERLLDA